MTERRRPRPPRRPSLRAVGLASLLAFAIVLALLVAQMRLGRDPVLGAHRASASVTQPPRRVLVRRVIVKRIVVHEVRDADDGGGTEATGTVVVTPTQTAAPAPAPSPAPAPAPAPLVTKSS
jgi:hypothetical protein